MEKRQIFSRRWTGTFVLIIALLALSMAAIGAPDASAASQAANGTIGGCPMFPANNIWNYNISHLPVSGKSAQYLASIGLGGHLHPDFGSGLYAGEPIGFPYTVVPSGQPSVPVHFTYADESDPGPYPIPANASIEGGSQSTGDRHVLVVERGSCKLYEMYNSHPQSNGSWQADSGAVWNLKSNALRPANWTSADAAGLPILPGLISYDEVVSGVINHALRFTVSQTQDNFIWPARHAASSSHNLSLPPMGLRLRLKASVSISSFSRTNQIILTALKRYGMFVADNGSSWYLSGTSNSHWNNDDLHALSSIPGSDFEVVDESSLELNANSGQVRGAPRPAVTPTPKVKTPTPSPVADTPQVTTSPVTIVPLHISTNGNSGSNGSSGGNGPGSVLWLVLGGIVLLAGIAGTLLLLLRQRQRARTKSFF